MKLNNDKKFIGDEFEEITDKENNLENLYDLVLPPGIPYKIIMDVMDKFNLEIVTRKVTLKTIDAEQENLLVLRGKLDDVNNAHDYIYQKLSEKYNYKRT
jgi:hypothetical protein